MKKFYFSGEEPYRSDIRYLETGVPQSILRKGFNERGRPRTNPIDPIKPAELKVLFNKPLKEFTYLQRRSYNRLASRRTYAKEKVRALEGMTSTEFKRNLNKKIKDFTKKEKREYNRLSKMEERTEKNLSL
tara:strand:+ start:36 stop:428 length:393 start_codon:yes stop_codon:yes gene_type:complete